MPVHHVAGVVEIQHHAVGRSGIAVHPLVDQSVAQADRIADCRRILQAREGWLRGQIRTRLRQVPAGELERRIRAQRTEVVAILIATRDGEDAGAEHVRDRVRHAGRIAPIRDDARQPLGDAKAALGLGQEYDAAVGRQASTVERGGDLLAAHGWKREGGRCIVHHGGCGTVQSVAGVGVSNQILRCFKCLSYIRQPSSLFRCIRTASAKRPERKSPLSSIARISLCSNPDIANALAACA